jgi:hypothetical protein
MLCCECSREESEEEVIVRRWTIGNGMWVGPGTLAASVRDGSVYLIQPQAGVRATRHCRDVAFLLLYIAFWGGMVYIAVSAFVKGTEYYPS